jgi:hypothetical protein
LNGQQLSVAKVNERSTGLHRPAEEASRHPQAD